MPINTLLYIYIYFYHMLHHSYVTGNTGMYRQNWNNGIDTDSHTENVHSNSCSPWGDKYIHKFLEVWMFLSCFYLPCKYQVPQNLSLRDGYFLHLPVELGSCADFTTEVVISKASFTLSIHIPLSSMPSPSTDHSNCCFYSPEVTLLLPDLATNWVFLQSEASQLPGSWMQRLCFCRMAWTSWRMTVVWHIKHSTLVFNEISIT